MKETVGPLFGTESGRAEISIGAGGDRTVEVDRLAESVAIEILEAEAGRGVRFSLLSEEIGRRNFGAEFPLVLLDPIDGSLNAKQGIPVYAVMASLLDGPAVGDVRAGYVVNLVSGETWTAIRGAGAWRDGVALHPLRAVHPGRIDLLGLESSTRSLDVARNLIRNATKIRILGSMAISIAHAASGGFDVFCSPVDARVFDMTASALILKEAGGVITDMGGHHLEGLSVGFESRSTLLAASDPAVHALALGYLAAASG